MGFYSGMEWVTRDNTPFMYFSFNFNSNNKCWQHFNFNNIHRGKKKRDMSALTESKSKGVMVLQSG